MRRPRLRTAVSAGLVAALAVAASPALVPAGAAAPQVEVKIVGRDRTLLRGRSVTASGTTVTVAGRRCGVAEGTPLAALLAARRDGRPLVRLVDYGSCTRRAVDGGGLYVTQIGADRRSGQAGWVYAVGGRLGTAGAADPAGPFGSGRLRGGARVTWYWCADASRCEEGAR